MILDAIDRRIIEATQAGLPLAPEPYAEIGASLGLDQSEIVERMTAMMANGVIRRIGAAPNHYAFGMTANGMTVWDVEDEMAAAQSIFPRAEDFGVHDLIDPRETRPWLCAWLEEIQPRLALAVRAGPPAYAPRP